MINGVARAGDRTMPKSEKEKQALGADDKRGYGDAPANQQDAASEVRRTLMKRLAISGFLAPVALTTLLKKSASASP
jgi:hypothetical protein